MPGELTLHKWRDGSNQGSLRLRADLTGPTGNMAAPGLIDALVVKITAAGMVIVGTELVPRNSSSKSNVDRYPQTWWCRQLPGAMELQPAPPAAIPKWRLAFDPGLET